MSGGGPCCGIGGVHSHIESAVAGETLLGCIDIEGVVCLNERVPDSGRNVFRAWETRDEMSAAALLESDDDDPELLLYVPFTQQVRLRNITVIGGTPSTSPSSVRLFANRDDLDFSTVAELTPLQVIELVADPSRASNVEYPVKPQKFFNVSSVTMHFPASYGGDNTQIRYICFRGEATQNRRGIVDARYEATAIPTDHEKAEDFVAPSIL